ncbi:hypothetical protein [Paenibacillus wenxiniae]|uniref:Uncharacterized protein n=1 Tax=Paenibacillus wenxiniae TaxID=1636843 RepID=A0ABW4RNN2_9BACL
MSEQEHPGSTIPYGQRNIHVYSLGHSLYPLDWELCFDEVEEYKTKLKRKYDESQGKYTHCIGELDVLYREIDGLLALALADAGAVETSAVLRCPPMIMALPRGDVSGGADFAIIVKLEKDGETLVYSPLPLHYLTR